MEKESSQVTERDNLAAMIARLPQRAREPLLRAFEADNTFATSRDDVESGELLLGIVRKAKEIAANMQMSPWAYIELAADIILYIGDQIGGDNDRAALRGQLEGLPGHFASQTAGARGKCGKCQATWNPRTHYHVFGIGKTPCVTLSLK